MSRICVKKIGRNVDEKALRELFSSKGEVTDVKVARKPDGTSRMFAFVGFRTEQQALDAQRYFDNTFIGLSRINVEIARKLNDSELAERKSKFSKNTAAKVQEMRDKAKALDEQQSTTRDGKASVAEREKAEREQAKQAKQSKYKAEFMDLVTGKASRILAPQEEEEENKKEPQDTHRENESDSERESDDDSAVDLADLVARQRERDGERERDGGVAAPAMANKALSDLDYLRSKIARDRGFSDDDESDSERDEDEDKETAHTQHHTVKNHTAQSDNESEREGEEQEEHEHNDKREGEREGEGEAEEEDARLIVKNLPFTVSEDELRALFSPYGTITEVHIPLSQGERKSKGFAFVTFLFPDHAQRAREELHGAAFQGRVLYVSNALRPVEREKREEDALLNDLANSKLSAFQRKREEERRKAAHKREGWNAAFVRSDAVVESLAAQYGVDSSAIMDTALAGGEMAVRLAIGEAGVVQENKDYLAAHGVDLNALESINSKDRSVKRSTTTLLVKNLPPESVLDELESMFSRYGALAGFISPKSKTVAVVDFVEPSEARAAFKGLAYRRYKNSPLYLEWAPLGAVDREKMMRARQRESEKDREQEKEKENKTSSSSSSGAAHSAQDAQDNLEEFSSLFIKNLNFSTTEDALRQHLLRLGVQGLRTVVIQKKFKGQVVLSQGFGFAEFQNALFANQALQRLDKSVLDSHTLEVKPSDKRLTAAPAALAKDELKNKNAKNSSKLIVRNLAFQATKAELRALFAAFGSVKTVRIPKKMGGNHRGFAFVDFATSQEAASAMAALRNTHLYGRHLVLEWAKAGEDEDGEDGDDALPTLMSKSAEASRKRAAQDQKVLVAVSHRAKRQKSSLDEDEDAGDVKELM